MTDITDGVGFMSNKKRQAKQFQILNTLEGLKLTLNTNNRRYMQTEKKPILRFGRKISKKASNTRRPKYIYPKQELKKGEKGEIK